MMKDIVLKLDESGSVYTHDGQCYIGSMQGQVVHADCDRTDKIIDLKKAGFTVEEIIALDQRGMLK